MTTAANERIESGLCPVCEGRTERDFCRRCGLYVPWPSGKMRVSGVLSIQLSPSASTIILEPPSMSAYLSLDEASALAERLASMVRISRETDFMPEVVGGDSVPYPRFLSPSAEVYGL